MIITENFNHALEKELAMARKLWLASAMISASGWHFIQSHLPDASVEQHFLIGTDLATDPKVFEILLNNLHLNARVYRSAYTFHPKVYLILKGNGELTAFIGSSNTTSWGLAKNVEVNFRIDDQLECQKLLRWFNRLFESGYLITDEFLRGYKARFKRAVPRAKAIESDELDLKLALAQDKGQFFSHNEHQVFQERYHRVASTDLRRIRKAVSDKLKLLHRRIYSRFEQSGLSDLHAHHHTQSMVSRHYFNDYSGNLVNAIWLHYGKSYDQLQRYLYPNERSFIDNIRLQVIVHEDSVGFWLVLGRPRSSFKDRSKFRDNLKDTALMEKLFRSVQNLGEEYWMTGTGSLEVIENIEQLGRAFAKEHLAEYFIIGTDIDRLDERLCDARIADTAIEAFQKLYPLYELFRHQPSS